MKTGTREFGIQKPVQILFCKYQDVPLRARDLQKREMVWWDMRAFGLTGTGTLYHSSVRFRQQLNGTENSNLHGFEVHRPSSKGTKLVLQVIKAIIINCTESPHNLVLRITKLSAWNVMANVICEHLMLVPGPHWFLPFIMMSYAPTPQGQPIWASFGKETKIFRFESRHSIISGKQQNLSKQQKLCSNEIQPGKSLCLFPKKRLPKSALIRGISRAVYEFKIW